MKEFKRHPNINIGGIELNEGEKITVWAAMQHFASYLQSGESVDLGPTRNLYFARYKDIMEAWSAAGALADVVEERTPR